MNSLLPLTPQPLIPIPGPAQSNEALLAAFSQFMNLDVASGNASADTVKSYHAWLRAFFAWCNETGTVPAALTVEGAKQYRAHLSRAHRAATVARYLTAARRFYAAARQAGLVPLNPFEGVGGTSDRRAAEDKMKALTGEALGTLLNGVAASGAGYVPDGLQETRDRLMVALMSLQGLRTVEIHRLDHDDLTPEGLGVRGKGGKPEPDGRIQRTRYVHLRSDVADLWENYCAHKRLHELPCEGAVFVSLSRQNRGARMSRDGISYVVEGHMGEAGVKRPGVSGHALRHTFGTLAVAGGARTEHLREAMGHANLETTGMYVRAVEKRKNNPANFIAVSLEK